MSNYLGDFPTGATIYVPFTTYNTAGASATLTGLAVTDIEIYKNGSTTQRASDAGYTLLDTDGIDFDGVTGLHGFSVDTSDNTDAGFYAAGGEYWIVVSAVTVDTQTVTFIAGTFSIERTGGVLALAKGANGFSAIKTDTAAILVDTGTTLQAELDGIQADTEDIQSRLPAALVSGRIDASVGAMANNVMTAAAAAADLTTELQSGLATAAALDTIDNFLDTEVAAILAAVDTEVAAIKAVTDALPDAGALTSLATQASVDTIDNFLDTEVAAILAAVDTEVAAIKAVTDALPDAGALTSLATQASVNTIDDLLDTEVAAIKTVVDAIKVETDKLGAPAGASHAADVAAVKSDTAAILADTGTDGVVVAAASKTGYRLSATGVGDIKTTAMTESYAADGAAPTMEQALFGILQFLTERSISTTTLTVNKLDGSTAAMTFTLDDANSPTSITRAT